jgi:hypothetical protein
MGVERQAIEIPLLHIASVAADIPRSLINVQRSTIVRRQIMRTRHLWLIVAGVASFMLGAGLAGGLPFVQAGAATLSGLGPMQAVFEVPRGSQVDGNQGVMAPQSSVAETVTYQGLLTNPQGQPLNGSHTMRFLIYNADVGGTAVWDSGDITVVVTNGLFKVGLDVDQSDFDGQALWLSMIVNGQTLSPRQSLLPVPYALSLRPGASVAGPPPGASGAVLGVEMTAAEGAGKALAGFAPSTGTAVHAQGAGGQGLVASSNNTYAVRGSSNQSWGGYFTSNQGYGIVASTSGTDHWDHAGVFEATAGYAVYATSSGNMAIRGESGNLSGVFAPLGNVGVVGRGQTRGLYGAAGSSYGLYATSLNWYGVYGHTNRPDNNYGFFTPDNLYALNINMAGALMNVAQNGGDEALEPGDVVLFSGISQPLSTNGSPVIQVARATTANSQAVAGVVVSRFNIEVTADEDSDPAPGLEVTPAGPVPPGEYLLLVVHGPAQVKASALNGVLQPGDLLSTAATAGVAAKAEMVTLSGVEIAVPGTILGKALEPVAAGQTMIYVFVTLQ